jgi:hypothetical protein
MFFSSSGAYSTSIVRMALFPTSVAWFDSGLARLISVDYRTDEATQPAFK